MVFDVIQPRRDVATAVTDRQRPPRCRTASVEDKASIKNVATEKETDREGPEGEVVVEERYLEGRSVAEEAAVLVYAVTLRDRHAVVLHPQALEALNFVPAVLERDASQRWNTCDNAQTFVDLSVTC